MTFPAHRPTVAGMDDRLHRLGRALRRARLWREMTQSEVAERCGRSLSTVQRWEAGESAPTVLDLGALCATLGVSADYFARAPDEDVDRLLLG